MEILIFSNILKKVIEFFRGNCATYLKTCGHMHFGGGKPAGPHEAKELKKTFSKSQWKPAIF